MGSLTDTGFLATIILIFIIVGSFLPFIRSEFGESSISVGVDDLTDDVGEFAESENVLDGFDVFISVIKMFFWTFGDLPLWLDSIFVVFRIILVWLVIRIIRGV